MGSIFSKSKSLKPGEQLSNSTLEEAFLASTVKENMKDMNDVMERRLMAIDSDCSSSKEVEVISNRLSSGEENLCTSEEEKAVVDRQSSLDENTCTLEETKSVVDRLSSLENNMSMLEEVKLMVEKLQEKLTSLEKHSTGIGRGFISEEATLLQHFDTIYKGSNVQLTNTFQTAERITIGGSLFGGVISCVPLIEDQVFRIIIEETTYQYGKNAIAFGVISEKEADVVRVPNIYNNIKGTWAIRSLYDSTSGKSCTYKGNNIIKRDSYPLDTRNLKVGTVLGVKLRSNGDLHFYLNGIDKGMAFRCVPNNVYAFVDILYNVIKISIV